MTAAPASEEAALWRPLGERFVGHQTVAIGKFLDGLCEVRMIDGLTTFPCDMREFLFDDAAKF
eukprot:11906445-Heterocapsa_arctica.AAC.1